MQDKIRIGIVGAGSIVKQRHLPGLAKIPGVEIVAVSNSTYESSRRFCEKHLPHATPIKNWPDLVALRDLDAVWIGTHPFLHAPVTVSALEAGHHVFCQARMAMNLAEAEEMLAAAKARPDRVVMLCPPPHGLTGDRVMRDLLASGLPGAPGSVFLRSVNAAFSDPAAPVHWRQRRELSGNNVLTLGIHTEVLQRWLGPVRSVFARARTLHPVRGDYVVSIPDTLLVSCSFEAGWIAALEFSGVHPGPPEDFLEIAGADARVRYDFSKDEISIARRGETVFAPVPVPPEQAGGWTVEADFIAALRGGPRPHPDFEDGVRYMRVVQAVADSLQTGGPVAIA